MTRRDDMVISPRVDASGLETPARATARAGRTEERAGRSRVVQRLRTVRKLQSARRRRALAQKQRTTQLRSPVGRRAARRAARAGVARGASRAAGAAARTPVGAIVTALAVIGVVATRLATGRPLEGLGADLSHTIFGSYDDAARARMAVRDRLAGDPTLVAVAKNAGVGGQIRGIADDLFRQRLREEQAYSTFEREYPANNMLDNLILRARDALTGAWRDAGGGDVREDVARLAWKMNLRANADPDGKDSPR